MDRFADTVDFLYGLRNRGSKYGLDRMVRFAAAAGNPERAVPAIHVAGTNGKGSVCAMLEAALRAAGHRTGLYTSPHLVHLGERVQVDRRRLEEPEIVRLAAELRGMARAVAPEGDADYPSFFEFMTLMAFLVFARERVDCSVVEVGLGGRLDATNVLSPEVAVITSVGLDHTEILGDTLGKIAGEKAGILKPGVATVLGKLPPEAREVVERRAADLGCPVVSVEDRFRPDTLPATNLAGRFQQWNAGTARLVLEAVRDRFPVSPETIDRSLRAVDCPGRWEERVVGGRRVIVDCTHNPEGAGELAANLRGRVGPPAGDLDVIVGSLGLERGHAVLRAVAPYARRIHLVRPNQPRARTFAEMREGVPKGFPGEVLDATIPAIFPGGDACSLAPEREPILLTGSLYLVGEVLGRIEPTAGSATGPLQDRLP